MGAFPQTRARLRVARVPERRPSLPKPRRLRRVFACKPRGFVEFKEYIFTSRIGGAVVSRRARQRTAPGCPSQAPAPPSSRATGVEPRSITPSGAVPAMCRAEGSYRAAAGIVHLSFSPRRCQVSILSSLARTLLFSVLSSR